MELITDCLFNLLLILVAVFISLSNILVTSQRLVVGGTIKVMRLVLDSPLTVSNFLIISIVYILTYTYLFFICVLKK